jgi:hypothetical protein
MPRRCAAGLDFDDGDEEGIRELAALIGKALVAAKRRGSIRREYGSIPHEPTRLMGSGLQPRSSVAARSQQAHC